VGLVADAWRECQYFVGNTWLWINLCCRRTRFGAEEAMRSLGLVSRIVPGFVCGDRARRYRGVCRGHLVDEPRHCCGN
jgi:hypothetical protein